jgi:hypothetical protein
MVLSLSIRTFISLLFVLVTQGDGVNPGRLVLEPGQDTHFRRRGSRRRYWETTVVEWLVCIRDASFRPQSSI